MEENNNNEKTILDKGKELAKNKAKNVVNKNLKKLLPKLLPIIGGFLLILLAVGVINLVANAITGQLTSIVSSAGGESPTIVAINEDGSYQIKSENLSQQILDALEKQNVDVEALGLKTEEYGDLLDAYIKAEIRTTYPKTGVGESDVDGIITIKRASVSTGKVENLQYKSYKDFCNLVSSNSNEALKYFSLNPGTLKLCIARQGNSVTYYDNSGNKISLAGSMSEGIVKEELDYQKYVKNYAAPLNFFISLHVISQDPKFMKEVLDMMVCEGKTEPIVLTYVDTKTIATTTYDYSGSYKTTISSLTEAEQKSGQYKHEGSVTEEELEKLKQTVNITNENVSTYYADCSKFQKMVSITNFGELYISKADTWIQYIHKEINKEQPKQIANNSSRNVKNEKSTPKTITVEESSTKMKKVTSTSVTETINSLKETHRYAVIDKASEIRVDDFIKLIKSYPRVKNNIATAPSNLFYLLQQSENTQNHEKIMRYVLYKLNDIDYGVLERDLKYLLADADSFISIADMLREFIRYWENASLPPTNADKTCYIIEDDGVGHPTVGYGVDIENSGYKQLFIDNGYPIEIGGEVPIEFVDSIEERIINNKTSEVKAYLSGLELTSYQINALVSRAYNCGTHGAIKTERGSPSMDFRNSYLKYWNQERDAKFDDRDSEPNMTHKLYVQYMSKPTTSGGTELAGLQKRRESEWILFQTGYYRELYHWHTSGLDIVEKADEIHKYMEANHYTYCIHEYGKRGDECLEYGKSHGLRSTFEDSKTTKVTCCATYVSWVIQEVGFIERSDHSNSAQGIADKLIQKGWKKITDPQEFEPGDVLCYYSEEHPSRLGHVDLYAGDGTKYNAGGGGPIRSASPSKCDIYSVDYALRAP